ncbi:family 43 glycoside hydrolase [Cryphonectria parasitica EP155]|uniref:Arabinan endo-1,5-alpha-L-arabinosidase n=1 Tax=Cryphonectria parasitica (strain ATCC 38755 / EP155) TaxID=660469 RepID=A0A9P4Y653_CRYP1|nr:family 43 glycoside hydrolase [Cryphonectria parasitica EP155]KAF3767082.1 family 43 glycoside hydrolase [Cryphonectria parasitica EP155]
MWPIRTALLQLLALSATVFGYPNPEPCTGSCFAQDPALIQRASDGVYFRFNTDTYIDIYKSTGDVSGPWENVGNVLPNGSIIDIVEGEGLWAPMVIEVNGTYILYYSVSSLGSQDSAIGYATSTTLEAGSWVDHGSTGVESVDGSLYNAIDPTMILVDDTYYLSFGSYWENIFLVAFDSNAETVADLADAEQVIYQPAGTHEVEASFPYYYDGYYYEFWSEGQANRYDTDKPAAGGEYKIRACRSSALQGPYTDENGTSCLDGGGNYILESHDYVYGPGAQGIFDDPTYGIILYYRYVNTTIGYAVEDYQWGWNVIDWVDGWPTL